MKLKTYTTKEGKKSVTVSIRLPLATYRAVREASKAARRSFSAEVAMRVEEWNRL